MNLLPCRHRRWRRCYFRRGLDTSTVDAHTLLASPVLAECLGRGGRNVRYAPLQFIAAFHRIPDRTPSGRDRRHRGRKPAGRRRVGRSGAAPRVAAFLTFFETTEARLAKVGTVRQVEGGFGEGRLRRATIIKCDSPAEAVGLAAGPRRALAFHLRCGTRAESRSGQVGPSLVRR